MLGFAMGMATGWAADPAPGTLLPSAVAMEAGHGEVSVTAAHGNVLWSQYSGAVARVGVAFTDRGWVEGSAVMTYDHTTCGSLLGACDAATVGGGAFAARYNVVQDEHVGFGPVLVGVAMGDGTVFLGEGLASELGGRRVRWDLTAVVLHEPFAEIAVLPFPVLVETGVSFRIGPQLAHQIRIGVFEVLPDLSYRFEQRRFFVEVGVAGIPGAIFEERLEVGLRF
jgi:hypothetical protein